MDEQLAASLNAEVAANQGGPFIRAFETKDKDDMVIIFNETAADALVQAGEEVLRIAAHLYCIPYFILQPENCFILDNGSGKAVGYIIGTPNNRTFVSQWRNQYIPLLNDQDITHPPPNSNPKDDKTTELSLAAHSPETKLLYPAFPELLETYIGHLHIDILPEFQSKGLGPMLMDAFLHQVQQQGCKGVHLGMVASNTRAGTFYERLGFSRFPKVLDGGESGEKGRDGGTVYMCKSFGDDDDDDGQMNM